MTFPSLAATILAIVPLARPRWPFKNRVTLGMQMLCRLAQAQGISIDC